MKDSLECRHQYCVDPCEKKMTPPYSPLQNNFISEFWVCFLQKIGFTILIFKKTENTSPPHQDS